MVWANSRKKLKTRQDKYAHDQVTLEEDDDEEFDDIEQDENQEKYYEGSVDLGYLHDGERKRAFSDQGEEYFDY